MSRRRRILYSIVVVLAFFGAIEGLLRATGWSKTSIDEVYSDIYDVEYVMSPGSPNPYTMQKETLNANGLRGPSFPLNRPEGVVRVVCLGDSTTFGMGPIEDSYPFMLQKILEEELGTGMAQVLNAGIPGTGFTQQLLFFQRGMRTFKPDVVCLTGGPNYRPDIKRYRDRLKSDTFRRLNTFRGWLAKLDIYRLLRRIIKGGPTEFVLDDAQIQAGPEESGKYLMDYWEDLERMRSIAEEDGFGLVFLNIPHQELMEELEKSGAAPDTPEYMDVVRHFTADHLTPRFARKYGFAFVDTIPGFIGLPVNEDLFFDPNHPARLGNEVIARDVGSAVFKSLNQDKAL